MSDRRTLGVSLVVGLAGLQGLEALWRGVNVITASEELLALGGEAGLLGLVGLLFAGLRLALSYARLGAAWLLWHGQYFGWLAVTVFSGLDVLLSLLVLGLSWGVGVPVGWLLLGKVVANAAAFGYLLWVGDRFEPGQRAERREILRRSSDG